MIDKLREILNEQGLFVSERTTSDIPIIQVNRIPGTSVMRGKEDTMRTHLFSFDSFFIKSPDRGKSGEYLKNEVDELIYEWNVWKKYSQIPITPKVAILQLIPNNSYFIVEKRYESETTKWPVNWQNRLYSVKKELRKYYEVDDKDRNWLYDPSRDNFLLTDICTVKCKTESA